MPPRLYSHEPLAQGPRALDAASARHVRVLRLDAGDELTLFDGTGGEWRARVAQTRKDAVIVDVLEHAAVERELAVQVHLAAGMPANDRMDFLVEKAVELGAASIQPLVTTRSILRIGNDRAAKKQAHWQAIMVAACEQCGRNRVPVVHAVRTLPAWLDALADPQPTAEQRVLLSPRASGRDDAAASPADAAVPAPHAGAIVITLSGPEGGLDANEEQLASARGFVAWALGPRILRAETAPLAALVRLADVATHAATSAATATPPPRARGA
jgi:16S rRNA (uracil1498-N3)-methyltransferase